MSRKFAAAHFTAQEALQFHSQGKPGKLEITPTKPLTTQRDLSLAYSPGVAVPVQAIAQDENLAYDYTNKGNLVAVVSNGTAILGLGNLGAQAAKPVMEGKAALFKRFADIDAIDLLVDTPDADAVINCVRYLGPSFGGINLEDIKAPDCFIIEEKLKEFLNIPVFHDDQHGTAIIAAAGLLNALELTGRHIETFKLTFPQLELIQPHAQDAFDMLVSAVENHAELPPSQCITRGGTIDKNPAQPGHCTNLLAP